MKILIRDIARQLYLGPEGTWVTTVSEARAFALGTAAINYIKRHGLTGVDLFCVFRNITFNTSIPVTAYEDISSSPEEPAGRDELAALPPTNFRVLLVEDDPDDAQLLKKALQTELSCDVVVAFTREVFESELESRRPDLIVSDSNVRAFSGMTALILARKSYPDVPFIFCSGNISPQKKETALAMGATAWTSKENCFRELVQVITRLVGDWR